MTHDDEAFFPPFRTIFLPAISYHFSSRHFHHFYNYSPTYRRFLPTSYEYPKTLVGVFIDISGGK